MSPSAAERYRARFRKVLDYIDTHLEEPLCVEQLGDVAAFSKCHFHRQFSELFGIGVVRYVHLLRLKRASYRLAFRGDSILDVALASGYEGPEAFARAFKRAFAQTPSEFKREPKWLPWHSVYQPLHTLRATQMMSGETNEVRIVSFDELEVVELEHRGDPRLLGDTIREFIDIRKANGLHPSVSRTFNMLYNDPEQVGPHGFRFGLCAEIPQALSRASSSPLPETAPAIRKRIPAGRCAVLRHVGSDDTLGETIRYLYATWLPQSGEELRDYPLFLERVRFFPDVADKDAITDVYLPLR